MRNSFLTGLLVLTTAAGLTSCGGKGGDPITQDSAQTVFNQFNSAVMNNMPKSNSLPALPVSGVSTNATVRANALDCETTTPNPLVDADGDNIAAEKNVAFDCTSSVNDGVSYTTKGSVKIMDLDDTVDGLLGGVQVDFDLPEFKSKDADGNEYLYSYVGQWKYSVEGSDLVSTADYTGRTKYKSGEHENDYTYNYTWDWAVTPDDSTEANYWKAGAINFSGTFTLDGKFVVEVGDDHVQQTGTWSMAYKGVDLVYDDACSGGVWYKSGSVEYTDGNGNTFKTVYDCTESKFYVNGVESDWLETEEE